MTPRNPTMVSQPFTFVTATDLATFKDSTTMKRVRKMVMENYLVKAELDPTTTDKRVTHANPNKRRKRDSSASEDSHRQRKDSTMTTPGEKFLEWRATLGTSPVSSQAVSLNSAEFSDTASSMSSHGSEPGGRFPIPRSCHRLKHKPGIANQELTVINAPPTSDKAKALYLADHFLDSFIPRIDHRQTGWQLPQPEINIGHLKDNCKGLFGSEANSYKWVPLLLRAPHSFWSTLCISSPYLDMVKAFTNGLEEPGDSLTTRTVRGNVLRLIREKLAEKVLADDNTIMAVLQLTCGDLISADHRTIHVHENALSEMIKTRGGLDELTKECSFPEIITITGYELGVLYEKPPDRMYVAHAETNTSLDMYLRKETSLETPLFPQMCDFHRARKWEFCSEYTIKLLKHIRDLTNVFLDLDYATSPSTRQQRRAVSGPLRPQQPHHSDRLGNDYVSLCNNYVSLVGGTDMFKPAADLDHPGSGDYVYEAVRLTAKLYTYSLFARVPFSVAARLCGPAGRWGTTSPNSYSGVTPKMICKALQNTPWRTCWQQMAGTLYWISLVAGAACHDPATDPVPSMPMTNGNGTGLGSTTSDWPVTTASDHSLVVPSTSAPTLASSPSSSIPTLMPTIFSVTSPNQTCSKPDLYQIDQDPWLISFSPADGPSNAAFNRANPWTEDESMRRWLVGTAQRCSCKLRFEHTESVLVGLRRLVQVQAALVSEA